MNQKFPKTRLTEFPGGVPPPHGVEVALERAQVEEGPLLVEARHLHPLVVARVVPEHRVHRRLALGVVVALAAHHVQEVADDGDAVLVARRVHRRQRLPLVRLLVEQPQLLAHDQLLAQDAAQRHQVGAVRADGRALRLHHRLHVGHHLVVAGLQEEVDAGVVRTHEVHRLHVVDELLRVHEGEADVLHELGGEVHAAVLVAQPAARGLEQVQLAAVFQAVAGQHERQAVERQLDEIARAQQRREVLQDVVVDVFVHLREVVGVGDAAHLHAVVQRNLRGGGGGGGGRGKNRGVNITLNVL